MSLVITLTEDIRSLAYFSDFKEDEVEIPDKPFVRELLNKTLDPEKLSVQELFYCIETCIYFALDASSISRELLWKIGKDWSAFNHWFRITGYGTGQETEWRYESEFPALVKAELVSTCGARLGRAQLIKLGVRAINPTCLEIVQEGNLRLLKWAHVKALEEKKDSFWDGRVYELAAEKGYLSCLRYARENCCPWNRPRDNACVQAIRNGHFGCFRFLYEQGCPFGSDVENAAAESGNLELLKYLQKKGHKWHSTWTCARAAENGHLDCLKYLHEHNSPWDENTTAYAARGGYLDCLRYAHRQGCPWGDCSYQAAREGHLDCLEYAHENGASWDIEICYQAARGGYLDCLRYAHEHGCPWDKRVYEFARVGPWEDCIKYLREQECPGYDSGNEDGERD